MDDVSQYRNLVARNLCKEKENKFNIIISG